jgi:hypothetical protein
MATPLVAGIAAYLWALKPSLTPVQLRDILQDAYDFAWVEGVLDAYHAVLRLDNGLANAPIRRALLDVATATGAAGTDGSFDEQDIEAFRLAFGDYAAARLSAGDPALTDHSRYDLNGDGITGDTTRLAQFDLDADGVLSVATRSIEGSDRDFDEAQVSDRSILCYYAYSSLYEGDPASLIDAAPECSGGGGGGPLPGVPPSLLSLENAGFRFDLGSGSAPVPGGGDCAVQNLSFDTLPPVAWRRTGTCTFPGGSVSGDVEVADDDRGSGSARAAVSGRFQTSASETSSAYAASGDDVYHYLFVTSDDVIVGTDGQMRARIAVRLKGEVPAFPSQCPGPLTQMYASIDVDVRSVSIAPDPTAIALYRGCWGSTTSPTSTREVTDTLTVPIDFRFGEPVDIHLQLYVSTQVVGTHSQSIDALAEVEYRLVEFLDLPLGALVRVGSGNRWGLPPLPAGGGALRTPERRPPRR